MNACWLSRIRETILYFFDHQIAEAIGFLPSGVMSRVCRAGYCAGCCFGFCPGCCSECCHGAVQGDLHFLKFCLVYTESHYVFVFELHSSE